MKEFLFFIIIFFFVFNIIKDALKSINKYKDKIDSQRKQEIFNPYFNQYYHKVKSLKTISGLESYRRSLPDANSQEIKKIEDQTGRNIIIETRSWIDEDIEKLRKIEKDKRENEIKEALKKKKHEEWLNTKNKLDISKGFLYILSNSSMPNLIKIGYTTKKPHKRANELYTTGVPTPFEVIHAWGTATEKKAINTERQIQSLFGQYRVHGNREFFQAECLPLVKKCLEDQLGNPIDLL